MVNIYFVEVEQDPVVMFVSLSHRHKMSICDSSEAAPFHRNSASKFPWSLLYYHRKREQALPARRWSTSSLALSPRASCCSWLFVPEQATRYGQVFFANNTDNETCGRVRTFRCLTMILAWGGLSWPKQFESMFLLNRAAQNNLEIDRNVGWLAIQSTRREAILTYSGQNVPVHRWTKRTEDLQV